MTMPSATFLGEIRRIVTSAIEACGGECAPEGGGFNDMTM
jgi:hypothetical protein